MRPSKNVQIGNADGDIRAIPKWARRYAQSRTLPLLVFLVLFGLAAGVFGALSYLAAWAYVNDRRVLATASVLALCALGTSWLWFTFVGAVRVMLGISQRLYRREGGAWIGGSPEDAVRQPPPPAVFLLVFCAFAHTALGLLGFLPIEYLQPVSALYVVPFMGYLGLKHRSELGGSPFMFLWPALYGIHALLIVLGVPIRLPPAFDVFVPVVGYGVLAALAAHIYNRVALRRLRRLAASPDLADEAEGQGR